VKGLFARKLSVKTPCALVRFCQNTEKEKAMDALLLLAEKRYGTAKGRMVYNGKPNQQHEICYLI
jgi:hypothetical protein